MSRFLFTLMLLFPVLAYGADWKPLFNGNNLSGWSGDPRLWKVGNKVIIGETNDCDKKITKNSFLIWQGGKPADFELEYKARVTVSNNSGVQYRSKVVDASTWTVGGYQMDLHPNPPYLGQLYEELGRGIVCLRGQRVTLTDKIEVTGKLETDDVNMAEWNTYRIVARGNVLQHFVNGKLAAEITDLNVEKRAAKGLIALQLHAGPAMKTEFKDLRLREFTNSPEATKTENSSKPKP